MSRLLPTYDRIRKIVSDHLDASIDLQEALITWYMTHPEELLRVESRLGKEKDPHERESL